MVALIGFLPVGDVMNTILLTLGRVAPGDVLTIINDQVTKIAEAKSGGLLTIGALGALGSTSAGVTAIIDTLTTYSRGPGGRCVSSPSASQSLSPSS
jgi:uncharacterized BrkB/YihY/UPF0761 family membrane protein